MNVQSFYPRNLQKVPQGQTNFRGTPGAPPELQLRRDDEQIAVDSIYPQHDILVAGDENDVRMSYPGIGYGVRFQRQGQNIKVDRAGFESDLLVRRDSNSVTLDRPGHYNDLTARFGADRIDISSPDRSTNISIQNRGHEVVVKQSGWDVESFPTKMFPGGWPAEPSLLSVAEFIGMNERTADSLDRWAKTGIDKDDLVRVDRGGQAYTYDQEYA